MAEIQPLLIFDTTGILAGKTALWQEWDRFGQSVIPQPVYAELEFLAKQAPDPQQEAIAREFLRYWTTSRFQLSEDRALVGSNDTTDTSLSKRARLEQAIAECAYALAKQQLGTLTVVVSNDRPLVNRVSGLPIANLCAVSVAELGQWIRQQQRPRAVEQALQTMPNLPIPAAPLKPEQSLPSELAPRTPLLQPIETAPAKKRPKRKPTPGWVRLLQRIQTTLTLILAFVLLSGSGLLAWHVLDPVKSEPIWKLLKLPKIPGLSPSKPKTN